MTKTLVPDEFPSRWPPKESNGRAPWPFVAWLLAIVVSALLTYNATSSSYDKRITVLENQYQRVTQDIAEIKSDVKLLLKRP